MNSLKKQLAVALKDAEEAREALHRREAAGNTRDTWKLQLALRYTRLPDVAGGVVPAAFVRHLEVLLLTRLSLSFDTSAAQSLVLLHRGKWEGDHMLVFEGVFVARPGTDGIRASAWYGMPRHFRNLFTLERWPPAYGAWGQGLAKDVTEARRLPGIDGDRIFRMVSYLDALHQEAGHSLDRMFDNAARRAAGHGFMEQGRQAAVVRQAMADMVAEAAHHKRALPHTSSQDWLRGYRDALAAALRRARRRGVDLDVGNLSAASATAEAMHGIMGAVAARMYAGVGKVLSEQFVLSDFVEGLHALERPWLHARPSPPDWTPAMYAAEARGWWDRVDGA